MKGPACICCHRGILLCVAGNRGASGASLHHLAVGAAGLWLIFLILSTVRGDGEWGHPAVCLLGSQEEGTWDQRMRLWPLRWVDEGGT
jgi:hypothetical protein